MKYVVNDTCIGCGMCAGMCPEVFSLTDEGRAEAIEGEVSQENLQSAADACSGCPVSAIEEA